MLRKVLRTTTVKNVLLWRNGLQNTTPAVCITAERQIRILSSNTFEIPITSYSYTSCRSKSSKSRSTTTSVDEDEDEDEDVPMGKGDKVIKARLKSTRIDALLKAGLQISRNKIEKAFYDDRIRINGDRPRKKSQMMKEGDEVDIVRCVNRLNPLFIDVSRVELLEIDGLKGNDDESDDSDSDNEDNKVSTKLKRYKTLTIKNYDSPWKGNAVDGD